MNVEKYQPPDEAVPWPVRQVSDEEWAEYQRRRQRSDLRVDAEMPKAARLWWRFRLKVLESRAYEHAEPSGHAAWDAVYNGLRDLIERRRERDHGAIIALHSPHGIGKTVLVTGLILLVTQRLESARYTKLHRFQRAVEEARQPGADPCLSVLLGQFSRPRLLVLDDCSAGYDTAASQRLLRDLLDDRYDANLDTLLVSNDSRTGFEQFLGTATMTRINHAGGMISCDWESFRE